jgi:hypothetical protein
MAREVAMVAATEMRNGDGRPEPHTQVGGAIGAHPCRQLNSVSGTGSGAHRQGREQIEWHRAVNPNQMHGEMPWQVALVDEQALRLHALLIPPANS